jgi:hypothetical protein
MGETRSKSFFDPGLSTSIHGFNSEVNSTNIYRLKDATSQIRRRITQSISQQDAQIMRELTDTSTEKQLEKNNSLPKQVHYSIDCIEDLPKKLSYIDVTMRVLSTDDPEYGGFKNLL